MAKSKPPTWLTVLSSGLAIAIFTFVANSAWETFRYRKVGPDYVNTSIRIEGNKVLFFVRNNSDEPLDLVEASIAIDEPDLITYEALGAYPDISKIYSISTSSGSSDVQVVANRLVGTLRITQAIEPKAADHFGAMLIGPAGPAQLSNATIHAEIRDIKGNVYHASYRRY